MNEDDRLMTSKEVCEYLRISKKTLASWIHQKKMDIPIYKIGGGLRFKRCDVDSLIVKVN